MGMAAFFLKKQLKATGLGIIGMYIVSKIPYGILDESEYARLSRITWALYGGYLCRKGGKGDSQDGCRSDHFPSSRPNLPSLP